MKPYSKVKRVLDFFLALLLILITSPIMVIAVIAIKVDSRGTAIFRQDRPGKNAKIFKVNKFRTMRIETEKNGVPLTDMERMTKVGNILRRTSLDELPQLFNILKGEMSFIGPRPLLVRYIELYNEEEMRRHEVTPGISGWAQVNGRNTISWEKKFEYDVYYVDNISFWFDVKILLFTAYKVIKRKDINSTGEDTMPSFTGSSNNNVNCQ